MTHIRTLRTFYHPSPPRRVSCEQLIWNRKPVSCSRKCSVQITLLASSSVRSISRLPLILASSLPIFKTIISTFKMYLQGFYFELNWNDSRFSRDALALGFLASRRIEPQYTFPLSGLSALPFQTGFCSTETPLKWGTAAETKNTHQREHDEPFDAEH